MKEPKKEINKRKCYSLKWNGKKHSRVQTIGEKKNEQIVPRATFSKLEQKILQFDIGNEKTNRIAWYSKVIIAGSWCFHFFFIKIKVFYKCESKILHRGHASTYAKKKTNFQECLQNMTGQIVLIRLQLVWWHVCISILVRKGLLFTSLTIIIFMLMTTENSICFNWNE